MSLRQSAFDSLIACLRGRVPVDPDWNAVIEVANHTLLSPTLFTALARGGQIDSVSPDVRDYLEFIHGRNRERNLRLRDQLFEAVAVFNRSGIVPLLLKGSVPLFLSPKVEVPDRMTSDLDVGVDHADLNPATDCLLSLGYLPVDGFRGMARPQDVGLFELRPRRGDAGPGTSEIVEREGVHAWIPSPLSRAEHWFLHDLIKEGDYVRGRLDLRHLHDLAVLSTEVGVDWATLRAALPDRMTCNALDVQLLALHDLFGVDVPVQGLGRASVRFHHWRRTFSARHKVAGAPLRVIGNLVWAAGRLSRLGVLARHGPVEVCGRAARAVFDLRPRSKL